MGVDHSSKTFKKNWIPADLPHGELETHRRQNCCNAFPNFVTTTKNTDTTVNMFERQPSRFAQSAFVSAICSSERQRELMQAHLHQSVFLSLCEVHYLSPTAPLSVWSSIGIKHSLGYWRDPSAKSVLCVQFRKPFAFNQKVKV